MDTVEQSRFDALYAQHLRALKLQGKAAATLDSYARAVRRVSAHVDRSPDRLEVGDLKADFAHLIDTRSWSLVKIERCALQFFYHQVLHRDWAWVEMVKPPKVQSLPDVLTVEEIARIIQVTRERRYQSFWLATYSLGLRLSEALHLQVGDIDAARGRVHVRRGKGRRDRFVDLPRFTVTCLRRHWCDHRLHAAPTARRLRALPADAAASMDERGVRRPGTAHPVRTGHPAAPPEDHPQP